MRTAVYVAVIPENSMLGTVYPPARKAEIDRCSNERVRFEKYYAWKLLELGIIENLGLPMEFVRFTKNEYGKWGADKCFFSISHSEGAVAVAVSDKNIGIDIEAVKRYREGIEQKILTPAEMQVLLGLDGDRAKEYIIRKWSEKESIFKTLDQRGFEPTKIETSWFSVSSQAVELSGKQYILSVCSDELEKINYNLNIKI